ncbi:MAG: ribonuclease D [Granulosicoccaceae bacterium]|jgi:ribonuclease D
MPYEYIDKPEQLQQLCRELGGCEWLALDTEFMREKTYYPQLCLIQINTGEKIYLVDAIALDDLSALCEKLEDPAITKIFHSASQDMELFYHLRGRVPAPLFDTQLAAALLGIPGQVSYATLVEKLCGASLDKSHARTDWSQRPLSEAQLRYAADDVEYLAQVYQLQRQQLAERGRESWHRDVCARLEAAELYANPPELAWQRLKGANRLPPQSLLILQRLAAWREQQAQHMDIPRRWVLADDCLFALADLRPQQPEELAEAGLTAKQLKRFGTELLGVIANTLTVPQDQWPEPAKRHMPSKDEKALAKKIRQLIQAAAEQHEVDPALLAPRRDIDRLVRGKRDVAILQGWRAELVGEQLEALLDPVSP